MVLLAPKDAAQLLGVSTSRIQQLARGGLLRELRDSAGRRLFRPQDVKALQRKRETRRRGELATKT